MAQALAARFLEVRRCDKDVSGISMVPALEARQIQMSGHGVR